MSPPTLELTRAPGEGNDAALVNGLECCPLTLLTTTQAWATTQREVARAEALGRETKQAASENRAAHREKEEGKRRLMAR